MPSVVAETNGDDQIWEKGSSGINGHAQAYDEDAFQHLPKLQQEILLLHGPRQKYSLETNGQIPELRSDREILIQVVSIGLNPVDWKSPCSDYNFGVPSFPWVTGRDFAGIVINVGRSISRVKTGDVVFGPSTDYRDVRKAAYQEYLITTDFNVARLPTNLSVNTGAALGVAFGLICSKLSEEDLMTIYLMTSAKNVSMVSKSVRGLKGETSLQYGEASE
ncbi:MAG: hypothetical protein Q9214_002046, partial [Letrouitia sp. 1 TL-2023]